MKCAQKRRIKNTKLTKLEFDLSFFAHIRTPPIGANMPPRRQSRSRRHYLSTSALSIFDLPKQYTSSAKISINTASFTNKYADKLLQPLQDICDVHTTLPETYQGNGEVYQQQHSAGVHEIKSPFLHVNISQPTEDPQSADKPAPPVLSNVGSAEIVDSEYILVIRTIHRCMRYLVPWRRILYLCLYISVFASTDVPTS